MIEETCFGFGDGRMLLHPRTIEFDIAVRCLRQGLKHFAETAECVVCFIAVVSLSAIKNICICKREESAYCIDGSYRSASPEAPFVENERKNTPEPRHPSGVTQVQASSHHAALRQYDASPRIHPAFGAPLPSERFRPGDRAEPGG